MVEILGANKIVWGAHVVVLAKPVAFCRKRFSCADNHRLKIGNCQIESELLHLRKASQFSPRILRIRVLPQPRLTIAAVRLGYSAGPSSPIGLFGRFQL